MRLLAELKRRNVIRIAGLYLVGSWLIVQVAGTLLPAFDAPAGLLKAVVVLLALGFFPALVAAWVFELTPDGLRRDDGVASPSPTGERTTKRMDVALVIGMLAVVGLVAADRLWPTLDPATTQAAGTPGGRDAASPDSAAAASGIGVLPFDNLSPDPDNAFFASGIHEEVLSRLARVDQLRVISRTSMEQIAAEELSVPEIGVRLGVSHVLEGSVRRAGDKVRITVQLIEAATDRHVWAENYDRTLDDVFAIQSEIALAITDQLQVALSAGEQKALADRPTENAEAYDLYLRAFAENRQWDGAEGFHRQIALLEPALALDPDFTEARAMLAEAYGRIGWIGSDPDGAFRAKAVAQVAELARRWPGSFDARLAQAMFHYTVERDYDKALAGLQALAAERPNDAEIALNIASSLKRLDRNEEQLVAMQRALALDPESTLVQEEMVRALGYNQRYDEAVALSDSIARRHPDDTAVAIERASRRLLFGGDRRPILAVQASREYSGMRAMALFSDGEVDAAVAELERFRSDMSPLEWARAQAEQAALLRLAGRDTEALPLARAALATMRAWVDAGRPDPDGYRPMYQAAAAMVAAVAGEDALAAQWMAVAEADPPSGPDLRGWWISELAQTARWRGDVDAAWARVITLKGTSSLHDPELQALRPYYDALYGDAAAYRAYMAELDAS